MKINKFNIAWKTNAIANVAINCDKFHLLIDELYYNEVKLEYLLYSISLPVF